MINSKPRETNNKLNSCRVYYQLGDKTDLELWRKIELKAGGGRMRAAPARSATTYTALLQAPAVPPGHGGSP